MNFKELVKKAQDKVGGTRADLAASLDVSPHTLDSWMKNEDALSYRNPPDWAEAMLQVLATGRPVTYVQGDIAITYQRAEDL